MTDKSQSNLSVESAQGLLTLLHEIDVVGDDYRDFVNVVCTARENLPASILADLTSIVERAK
jgi:hypothetical protein